VTKTIEVYMQPRIGLFLTFVTFISSVAESADWKFIGKSSMGGKDCYAYYDELTIEKKGNGNVSAWIKLVSRQEVDEIFNQGSQTVVELTKQKAITDYVPPVFAIGSKEPSSEAVVYIIMLEVIVNEIKPATKLLIHYEIACAQRKSRGLSSIKYNDQGETIGGFSGTDDWETIAPDTFGEVIMRILCMN
jgi:hypothetical protein